MNTPDDEPVDEVTSAYRRASDAEAGRPASSTRAAILAEARAAALRRTPAANHSLYAWRAVAGIAVIGVAVLLWRQADRSVTPELTVKSAAPTVAPERVAEDRRSVAEVVRPVESPRLAAVSPQAGADMADAAQSTARIEREESKVASTARADAAPAPALAAGALRQTAIDYQGMLQREFPEVWNAGTPPRTVWVVLDAAGKAVRKGELPEDASTLASVSAQPASAWTVVQVKTASGSPLQLAVMQVD